jgi:hypothetical protein
MMSFGPSHCHNRDRTVERHQPSAMFHSEREQVYLGEWRRTEDKAAVDHAIVEK